MQNANEDKITAPEHVLHDAISDVCYLFRGAVNSLAEYREEEAQ